MKRLQIDASHLTDGYRSLIDERPKEIANVKALFQIYTIFYI